MLQVLAERNFEMTELIPVASERSVGKHISFKNKEYTIVSLQDAVNKNPGAKGFIFDGFPRTNAQAEALDAFLDGRDVSITSMIALEVGEQELKVRLLERGKTSGRADDAVVA